MRRQSGARILDDRSLAVALERYEVAARHELRVGQRARTVENHVGRDAARLERRLELASVAAGDELRHDLVQGLRVLHARRRR